MPYYKYPRTPHLPWSLGIGSNDKIIKDTSSFHGKLVVVTEKMDGENTTIYKKYLHARSIDSRHHISRDWIKAFSATFQHLIPDGWRICGENLFARHSIEYTELDTYFYLFSVWNEKNVCLSWEQTMEWANLIGTCTPRILHEGLWDEDFFKTIDLDTNKTEGYVIRLKKEFSYVDFSKCCAKWVRSQHVQTDEHWMNQAVVPNRLKSQHE